MECRKRCLAELVEALGYGHLFFIVSSLPQFIPKAFGTRFNGIPLGSFYCSGDCRNEDLKKLNDLADFKMHILLILKILFNSIQIKEYYCRTFIEGEILSNGSCYEPRRSSKCTLCSNISPTKEKIERENQI